MSASNYRSRGDWMRFRREVIASGKTLLDYCEMVGVNSGSALDAFYRYGWEVPIQRRRKADWLPIMRAAQESGLPLTKFCAEAGIGYWALYDAFKRHGKPERRAA